MTYGSEPAFTGAQKEELFKLEKEIRNGQRDAIIAESNARLEALKLRYADDAAKRKTLDTTGANDTNEGLVSTYPKLVDGKYQEEVSGYARAIALRTTGEKGKLWLAEGKVSSMSYVKYGSLLPKIRMHDSTGKEMKDSSKEERNAHHRAKCRELGCDK